MGMRPLVLIVVPIFVLACVDDPQVPDQLASRAAVSSTSQFGEVIPERSSNGAGWRHLSDSDLWAHLAENDKLFVVGLKEVGAIRGVWKDRVLITRERRTDAIMMLKNIPGIELLKVDTLLPVVLVRLSGPQALSRLRHIPFADYVEPAIMRSTDVAAATSPHMVTMSSEDGSGGCGYNTWSGTAFQTFAGDILPPNYRRAEVQIDRAWNRANGSNVTIGLVDTGVSQYQANLGVVFSEAHSSGRWIERMSVISAEGIGEPDWHDFCGHGTRMAGVIAAPMNGLGVAGAAWKANLLSVRQANAVADLPSWNTVTAIREAASQFYDRNPRRIVTLAFDVNNEYDVVADEIRYWYARERLFIGASGTSSWGISHFVGVIFPAKMPEVIAVSGVNNDFSSSSEIHYGSEVELSFFLGQIATGRTTNDIVRLSGSSGTSAVISGIAALIWSRYPNASRDWVRERLRWSANAYPNRNSTIGYGVPNAWKASGGMYGSYAYGCSGYSGRVCEWPMQISGCTTLSLSSGPEGGDGPFSYEWSNGSTSSTTALTLCSDPAYEQEYSISNSIIDLSDGTSMYKLLKFRVRDPAHCGEDPNGGPAWPCLTIGPDVPPRKKPK